MPQLIIGNKRYSSWSIRPWFFLKHAEIAFEEVVIPLFQPETKAKVSAWSESARLPVLVLDDGTRVWDSLAIGETIAEQWPDSGAWPSRFRLRAIARSACAEMHSGFAEVRRVLTHNVMRRYAKDAWRKVAAHADAERAIEDEVSRLHALMMMLLETSGGPFLGGPRFGYVDAFFVPIVSRFATYAIASPDGVTAYRERIESLPTYALWRSEAAAEPWRIVHYELDIGDRGPA